MREDLVFNKQAYNVNDIKYTEDIKEVPMVDSYTKKNDDLFTTFNYDNSEKSNLFGEEHGSSPFQKIIADNISPPILNTEAFNSPTQKALLQYDFDLGHEKPRSTGTSVISFGESEDGLDKKEKNRVSARECRQRKKKYIESLESELAQTKAELKKCKDIIEEYRQQNSIQEIAPQKVIPFKSKISSINNAYNALIESMLTPLSKYILWFPANAPEVYDKKGKKPIKYVSLEQKGTEE